MSCYELQDVFRDGADTETVVCALFHDVGVMMSPVCHGDIGKYFILSRNLALKTLSGEI